MILILSFLQVMCIKLLLMFDFVLQKASSWVESHHLDIWVPAHLGAEEAAVKLVSSILYSYAYHLLYLC
jgi:hypothetical protein